MVDQKERDLIEQIKHAEGKCGGFSFGGQQPDGVTVHNALPGQTVFPNGAKAALLLTFDVEGNYGNGAGDIKVEIANYKRICQRLVANQVPATFNIVGKMAEEHGPDFVQQMVQAGCEVAPHGYVHDMDKRHGGQKVYTGHYGPEENLQQVRDGIDAINRICPHSVRGIRMPYGHFNEYTYDAIEKLGLTWASNVGIDDFIVPGQGFGNAPFQMQLGSRRYPIVEIPLDSQTFDWAIWIADQKANAMFVKAVQSYCTLRDIPFERTPHGAVRIWQQRMLDAIENQTVFTLICHPTNLAVKSDRWSDAVGEFLFPVIDQLGEFQQDSKAWVCTCCQLAEFYWQVMKDKSKAKE